jgi:hypothetical protein
MGHFLPWKTQAQKQSKAQEKQLGRTYQIRDHGPHPSHRQLPIPKQLNQKPHQLDRTPTEV